MLPSVVMCLHKRPEHECVICQSVIRLRDDPLSEERAQIARYLKHVAQIRYGSVLGPAHHEGIGFAASWVENRLDEKWTREATELAERSTRELHRLIRAGEGDSVEADLVREKIVESLECLSPSEKKRLNDLSGDLMEEYEKTTGQ